MSFPSWIFRKWFHSKLLRFPEKNFKLGSSNKLVTGAKTLQPSYGDRYISTRTGCFQQIGVPKNGWFFNVKPYWNGWFGGITIFGNVHIYQYLHENENLHGTKNSGKSLLWACGIFWWKTLWLCNFWLTNSGKKLLSGESKTVPKSLGDSCRRWCL